MGSHKEGGGGGMEEEEAAWKAIGRGGAACRSLMAAARSVLVINSEVSGVLRLLPAGGSSVRMAKSLG